MLLTEVYLSCDGIMEGGMITALIKLHTVKEAEMKLLVCCEENCPSETPGRVMACGTEETDRRQVEERTKGTEMKPQKEKKKKRNNFRVCGYVTIQQLSKALTKKL